jgi:PKD repeat protein
LPRRPLVAIAASLALLLTIAGLGGTSAGAAPSAGAPVGETDLLDMPRHGEDAIVHLGSRSSAAAARNGRSVSELHAKLRSDPSFYVDKKGHLVVHDTELVVQTADVAPTTASAPAAVVPYAQTFELHSRPGANRVIYLDFDGHAVSGTAWNSSYTSGAPFTAAPYDTDGSATFSTAEQDVVQSVWQRVAEDFSAFDVDVTTQDPGDAAITRSGSTDLAYGTRAVITNTSSIYSSCSCGGIAYVGTFDITSNHASYQPAFVFQRGVGAGAHNIAEAASHEVGHNLGLSHDGTSTTGYYAGHDGWAPIMGVGYYQPLTQWSSGEYADANNTEDDWAVMQANGAVLRTDDHGSTQATATALTGPTLNATGRIGTSTDTDWFSFTTPAGAVALSVAPAPLSPDLDASLTVFDAAGQQVAVADPLVARYSGDVASGLDASLTVTLTAGSYAVRIDGVGARTPSTGYSDYGSAGQYTLSGTLPQGSDPEPPPATPNVAPTAVASGTPTSGAAPLTVAFTSAGSTDSDGTIVSRVWSWGDGTAGAAADGSHTYTAPGTYQATVTVTDDDGAPASASVTIVVASPPPPVVTVPSAPSSVTAAVSGRTVTVRWGDTSSNETGFTVRREKLNKNGTWGSATTVATVGAGVTSLTNSPGRGTYRYSVRSNNSAGSSAYVVSSAVTL